MSSLQSDTPALPDGHYILRLAYLPAELDAVDIVQVEWMRMAGGVMHFANLSIPWVNPLTDLGGARIVAYMGPYKTAFERQYGWNVFCADKDKDKVGK